MIATHTKGTKICIVTNDFPGPVKCGGTGTAYLNLAEVLRDAGFSVTVLYVADPPSAEATLQGWANVYNRQGIAFEPLPLSARRLRGGTLNAQSSYAVYTWLAEREFRIIHFHAMCGLAYFSCLAKRQGLAFKSTTILLGLHSASEHIWEADTTTVLTQASVETFILETESVASADCVISPSHYFLKWLRMRGWNLPRSRVIPNCLAPSFFSESVLREPRAVGPIELVFFGRLEKLKGLSLFVDAIDVLLTNGVSNFTITFLGKPWGESIEGLPVLEYLEYRTSKWPVAHTMLFDFTREQALQYLQAANRVAVIPTLAETFGYTVLECVSLGIPFVASNIGGVAEIIDERDRDRVLFSPTPANLAGKLAGVLKGAISVGRPNQEPDKIRGQWIRLHHEIADRREESCNIARVAREPLLSVVLQIGAGLTTRCGMWESLAAQTHRKYEVICLMEAGASELGDAEFARFEAKLREQGTRCARVISGDRSPAGLHEIVAEWTKGDYIVVAMQDVLWRPEALSTLVRVVAATSADLLTAAIEGSNDSASGEGGTTDHWVRAWIGGGMDAALNCDDFGSWICAGAREVFESVGRLNTVLDVFAPRDLLLCALALGYKVEPIPLPLGRRATAWEDELNHTLAMRSSFANMQLWYWSCLPGIAGKLCGALQGRLRDVESRLRALDTEWTAKEKVWRHKEEVWRHKEEEWANLSMRRCLKALEKLIRRYRKRLFHQSD